MWKKRKQAEAALRRLGRGTTLARSGVPAKAAKNKQPTPVRELRPVTATCPRCFVALPTTGRLGESSWVDVDGGPLRLKQ